MDTNNQCTENGCERNATSNYKGNPPIFCRYHKENGMINVNSLCDICYYKYPSYNLEALKPKYCFKCKTDNMIDVKNPKCMQCNKPQPKYNKPGLLARYCKDCKTDDMIDISHLKCIKCSEFQPIYNKPGLPARYCVTCKKDGMVDVVHKRCEKCDRIRACFNKPGLPARYCEGCKDDGMINVVHSKCIECNEIRISNSNYDNHCLRCFIYKFPDNKISRKYKVKERYVQDFLEEKFPDEFIYDKTIDQGCSKRRPDAFKECGTHTIIIEVDEYQHRNYEEICENKRTMEIFTDLSNRPIIFIRFNPDNYINENNDKIKSSFNMHKTSDVPIIKDPIEWQGRLDKLKETIEHHIDTIPEKTVTIEKLFYDEI
jgi:EsV-1-7 cysteine-rich motif